MEQERNRRSSPYAKPFEGKIPTAIFRGRVSNRKFGDLRYSLMSDECQRSSAGLINSSQIEYVTRENMCRHHQVVVSLPGNGVWSWATKYNMVRLRTSAISQMLLYPPCWWMVVAAAVCCCDIALLSVCACHAKHSSHTTLSSSPHSHPYPHGCHCNTCSCATPSLPSHRLSPSGEKAGRRAWPWAWRPVTTMYPSTPIPVPYVQNWRKR